MRYDDLIGIPFVDGGRDESGCDCWGLACLVYRRHGIALPDYKISCDATALVGMQIEHKRAEWVRCEGVIPAPALVVMRFNSPLYCNHVGVYIGGGRFIHTARRMGCHVDHVESPAWKKRIEGFYVPGR